MIAKKFTAIGSTLLLVASLLALGAGPASARITIGGGGGSGGSTDPTTTAAHWVDVYDGAHPTVECHKSDATYGTVSGDQKSVTLLSGPWDFVALIVNGGNGGDGWGNKVYLAPLSGTPYSPPANTSSVIPDVDDWFICFTPQATPTCIQSPSFSYTFLAATGSGVITVTGGAANTPLCDPLAVRAAAWNYDLPADGGQPSWPQTLAGYNDVAVGAIGSFNYGPPQLASCRQYDIYASFGGFGQLNLPTNLLDSHNPSEPAFLHEALPGDGPNPTYSTTSSSGCNDIPIPVVTLTDAQCNMGQTLVLPSLPHVTWGTPVYTNGGKNYSVVATAIDGFNFVGGATTTTITGTLAGKLKTSTHPECQPSVSYVKVCGSVTITFHNPSPWGYAFEYRVPGDVASGVNVYGTAPDGLTWTLVNVASGSSETRTMNFAEDSAGLVQWRLVLGAESDYFVTDWQNIAVSTNCSTTCRTIIDGGVSTNLDANGWTFGESRSKGHHEYVAGGLHIWTDDSSSDAKSAGYVPVDVPLTQIGEPTLDYTSTSGAEPGINLVLYVDGVWKGTLVKEPLFPQWWMNKTVAGMPAGPNPGYQLSYGSLDEFVAAYAANGITDLQIKAIGFSLGSGAQGDGVITAMTAGCVEYTFDYEPVVIQFIAPHAVDPDCTTQPVTSAYIKLDQQPNLSYTIDGVPTSQVVNPLSAGTYQVVATAAPGFTIVGQSTWQIKVASSTCQLPTHSSLSTTATMTNLKCTGGGSYTLAATPGIRWLVNGTITPAGTYSVTTASTVNVDAEIIDPVAHGWDFGAQNAWTFSFTNPVDCLPTLAFSGSEEGALEALMASGLLLGGALVLISERRRRVIRKS